MMTKITVGGSRTYNNYTYFENKLKLILSNLNLKDNIIILSGHCKGVDMLAEAFAQKYGLSLEIYPPLWNKYGKRAGPIRNEEMVKNSNIIIAFWDKKSKGTSNLIKLAEKHNKTLIIEYI